MSKQEFDTKLTKLELSIERAKCVLDFNLADGFFSQLETMKDEDMKYYLISAWPDAKTYVAIVQDYLMQAKNVIAEIEKIAVNQEGENI